MSRSFLLLAVATAAGCGPSAHELRERTLSVLNTEADRWPGGPEFATTATDAYGQPLACKVEKGPVNFVLEVRSPGPDGLPKNNDDVVVTRSKRHGESSYTEEAAKATEKITEAAAGGAVSGAIKGVKKGLGLGTGKSK